MVTQVTLNSEITLRSHRPQAGSASQPAGSPSGTAKPGPGSDASGSALCVHSPNVTVQHRPPNLSALQSILGVIESVTANECNSTRRSSALGSLRLIILVLVDDSDVTVLVKGKAEAAVSSLDREGSSCSGTPGGPGRGGPWLG
jgi:hypothetical protein